MEGAYQNDNSIYENEVPSCIGKELERLYESVYCTLGRFDIYGEASGASTYVAKRGGQISAVILFRIKGYTLFVVNQQIWLPADELLIFLTTIFQRYQSVWMVRFYAVEGHIPANNYRAARFPSIEEHVIELPVSQEQYMASLGSNTRKNLRSAERKLIRDFPSFQYEIFPGNQIAENIIREIFALSGMRMQVKGKSGYLGDRDSEKIVQLIRLYGQVGVATANGKICAGNIWYSVGRRNFMHIIAHDPKFDPYMLGNHLIFLTFCECIKRGAIECRLMGGGRQHKSRFLAKSRYLHTSIVFRSRLVYALNYHIVLAAGVKSSIYVLKEKLIRLRESSTRSARVVNQLAELVRFARRLGHAKRG